MAQLPMSELHCLAGFRAHRMTFIVFGALWFLAIETQAVIQLSLLLALLLFQEVFTCHKVRDRVIDLIVLRIGLVSFGHEICFGSLEHSSTQFLGVATGILRQRCPSALLSLVAAFNDMRDLPDIVSLSALQVPCFHQQGWCVSSLA